MLQEQNRLRKKRDIEITFEEGRFVAGNFMNMKVWKVDNQKYSKRGYKADELKFAFVVGVKIDKRAVVRNRLKRQMREVVRLLIKDEKIKKGFFVMLMAKKEMIGREYAEIEADCILIFKRARIFEL